jgi:hypothetical protein
MHLKAATNDETGSAKLGAVSQSKRTLQALLHRARCNHATRQGEYTAQWKRLDRDQK